MFRYHCLQCFPDILYIFLITDLFSVVADLTERIFLEICVVHAPLRSYQYNGNDYTHIQNNFYYNVGI